MNTVTQNVLSFTPLSQAPTFSAPNLTTGPHHRLRHRPAFPTTQNTTNTAQPPLLGTPHAHTHEQPFADDSHAIQQYFLAREYAVAIPCALLVLLVVLATGFIGSVMLKKKKKKSD